MGAGVFAALADHAAGRLPGRRARRLAAAAMAVVQPMEPRVLLSAALIKDINTTHPDANPNGFVVANGQLYFTATDGVSPNGSLDGGTTNLWKTDGTPAGTVPLGNLFPDGSIQDLTDVNGTLYFLATGPNDGKGAGLYRSNGTAAGTSEVMSFPGSYYTANDGNLTNFNGTLFFTIAETVLWKSDGTAAGTVPVSSIPVRQVSKGGVGLGGFTPVGNTLYFVGSDGTLWKTDGTTAGTVAVGQLSDPSISANLYPSNLTPFDGELYFLSGGSLGKTDGTATGTQIVSPFYDTGAVAHSLFNDQGTLFFETTELGGGDTASLWKSDGTTAGTVEIATLNLPSALQSYYTNFAELNGTVYFAGSDESHGVELWRSDGTVTGTSLLDDINPGPASGIANEVLGPKEQFISFDDKVYFSATDGIHGQQLWQTDGTAGGTSQFVQINTATNSSTPSNATNPDMSGGVSYFVANDGVHGPEVWQTDGTSAGTEMLTDINPTGSDAFISPLFADNGAVYFTDNNETSDNVYVVPRPSAAPVMLSSATYAVDFTALGGRVYMLQEPADGSNNAALGVTDGTVAGTYAVTAIGPGGSLAGTTAMADVNGTLLFTASDSSGQMSLWRSDGTQAGTSQVVSFQGTASFNQDFEAIGNELYFIADDGANGPALWKSDGTSAGTSLVYDSSAGAPDDLTDFNGNLYFSVLDATDSNSNGLYETDGTTAGTVLLSSAQNVSNLTTAFGKLFFIGFDSSSSSFGIHSTDGTPAGTVLLDEGIGANSLVAANGALYFVSADNQLWETDGTTAWLADRSETPSGWTLPSYGGALLGPLDGGLLFVGVDSVHGQEPWLFTPAAHPQPPPPISALVPTLSKVELASQLGAGARLNASVPVVVTNSGTPLKGLVTVDLYADTGTTLDTSQVLVATEKRHVSLKSNQKMAFNFSVKTLPASLADETYHLIAEVIDPSGNVNAVATSQTVQLSAPVIEPSLSFAAVSPATIAPGGNGSVLITVTNNGTIASAGGTLTLHLSADGVIPVPDVTLASIRSGPNVPAGASKRLKVRFRIPRKLAAGTYYCDALLSLGGVPITAVSPSTFTVS